MKNKSYRILSIILLIFLGLGGLYGSLMLLIDPTGVKMGFSSDLLNGTPFNNYLVPGIVLLLMNGLLPLFVSYLAIRRVNYYGWWIFIQGAILFGWLSLQIIFNPDFFVPGMHITFFITGILLMLLGFLARKPGKE